MNKVVKIERYIQEFFSTRYDDYQMFYRDEHKHRHYEVFKKRLNRRFGTVSYPTDKAFGIWAWSCMSLERARERLNEIEIIIRFSTLDKNSSTSEKILYVP